MLAKLIPVIVFMLFVHLLRIGFIPVNLLSDGSWMIVQFPLVIWSHNPLYFSQCYSSVCFHGIFSVLLAPWWGVVLLMVSHLHLFLSYFHNSWFTIHTKLTNMCYVNTSADHLQRGIVLILWDSRYFVAFGLQRFPVSKSYLPKNALLMPEVRGEWSDGFMLGNNHLLEPTFT